MMQSTLSNAQLNDRSSTLSNLLSITKTIISFISGKEEQLLLTRKNGVLKAQPINSELPKNDEVIVKKKHLIALHRLTAYVSYFYGDAIKSMNDIAEETGLPLDVDNMKNDRY